MDEIHDQARWFPTAMVCLACPSPAQTNALARPFPDSLASLFSPPL